MLVSDFDLVSREERKELASVVMCAVEHDGQKIPIIQSIDRVVGEYRAFVLEESDHIHLPHTLPIEKIPQIKE